jgi:hypothetical protein
MVYTVPTIAPSARRLSASRWAAKVNGEVIMGRVLVLEVENIKKGKYCCLEMNNYIKHQCRIHASPFECPDNIVYYSPMFRDHGIIIHDGSTSYITIRYCPWCGKKLPTSMRNKWFEELAKTGMKYELGQDIPKKFLSEKWYKLRKKKIKSSPTRR